MYVYSSNCRNNVLIVVKKYSTLFLIVLIFGCGQYDDGPAISLVSKAKRLEGTWVAVYQNQNGYEFLNDLTLTLANNSGDNKNPAGDYQTHVFYSDGTECYFEGTWSLTESKGSLRVDSQRRYCSDINGDWDTTNFTLETVHYEEILRLTKKEYWMKYDPVGPTAQIEVHFEKVD